MRLRKETFTIAKICNSFLILQVRGRRGGIFLGRRFYWKWQQSNQREKATNLRSSMSLSQSQVLQTERIFHEFAVHGGMSTPWRRLDLKTFQWAIEFETWEKLYASLLQNKKWRRKFRKQVKNSPFWQESKPRLHNYAAWSKNPKNWNAKMQVWNSIVKKFSRGGGNFYNSTPWWPIQLVHRRFERESYSEFESHQKEQKFMHFSCVLNIHPPPL